MTDATVLLEPHAETRTQRLLQCCALFLLLCLHLASRLANLNALPLFNDEAVYIVRGIEFPGHLQETLGEGKLLQELLFRLLLVLPGDPLVLLRLLSVAAGLATVVLLSVLGRALNRPWAGLLAGLCYIGAPGVLLHDTLGLGDALLTTVGTVLLLASLTLAHDPRSTRRQAAAVGLVGGVAALVKLPGLFLLVIPILALWWWPRLTGQRRKVLLPIRTIVLVALACIAVLAPFHYGGSEISKVSGRGLSARLAAPLSNVQLSAGWLALYLPAVLLLALPLAWIFRRVLARRDQALILLLTGMGAAVLASFILLGSQLFSRYILPAWPALLLACGLALYALWSAPGDWRRTRRLLCAAILSLTLLWDLRFALAMLRDPRQAPLDTRDRHQYLETWTAGAMVPELLSDLRQRGGAAGGITLVNHDQPRLVHLATKIYLRSERGIALRDLDVSLPEAAPALAQLSRERTTYVLLDDQERRAFRVEERLPALKLARRYDNPLGTMQFYLYQVDPG